jgi:hypothetical protein
MILLALTNLEFVSGLFRFGGKNGDAGTVSITGLDDFQRA